MFVLVAAPQAGPAKVCTSQHCEIPIGNRRNAPANLHDDMDTGSKNEPSHP